MFIKCRLFIYGKGNKCFWQMCSFVKKKKKKGKPKNQIGLDLFLIKTGQA